MSDEALDRLSKLAEKKENESEVIFRYLDFPKFVSLIQSQKLFFPLADILTDQTEGIPHHKSEILMLEVFEKFYEGNEINKVKSSEVAKSRNAKQEYVKKLVTVSSWQKSTKESYGMWKSYVGSTEGVAIKSSISKIRKSIIDQFNGKFILYDNIVNYNSFSNENIGPEYISPFFKKNSAYDFEKEYRFIIDFFDRYKEKNETWEEDEFKSLLMEKGIGIKINLQEVIDEIVVSPFSRPWFHEVVKKTLEQYKLNIKIRNSIILDK